MGQTVIEKILSLHSNEDVQAGDVTWIGIDVRSARDFGGANVVKILEKYGGGVIDDISRTYFTFDCNVPPTNEGYADNQHFCRRFARWTGVHLYDIDNGIGSHILLEKGHVIPGSITVGTDSHLNIMGAVGAFGQGMGDTDIAFVFRAGQTWFEVPETVVLNIDGYLAKNAHAKDLVLSVIGKIGTKGLLRLCAEVRGEVIDNLSLAGRITFASMATEMGAIATIIEPNDEVLHYIKNRTGLDSVSPVRPDEDADYMKEITLDLGEITPKIAKPYSPGNVADVSDVEGLEIDSGFIGSCTNGRFEDMYVVAKILKGKRIKKGFLLKIVPATTEVYNRMVDEGIMKILRDAGAIVGAPGCGGCAAGQIGIIGEGEIQLSTSNRNFKGKQGKGETYLTSPAVVAASALTGKITIPPEVDLSGLVQDSGYIPPGHKGLYTSGNSTFSKPKRSFRISGTGRGSNIIEGRVWTIVDREGRFIDNIDTDMIFHNRYLHITDIDEMGQYAFDNLDGYRDFSTRVKTGDIILVGENFGSGSSRAQAVDCFKSLGISLILGRSFGAIYRRNAINSGLAVMESRELTSDFAASGQRIMVDTRSGLVKNLDTGGEIRARPFFSVQREIYAAGGLYNIMKVLEK